MERSKRPRNFTPIRLCERERGNSLAADAHAGVGFVAIEQLPRLPSPGDVVMFTPTKLHLYRNCCQIDTKLQATAVVAPPLRL